MLVWDRQEIEEFFKEVVLEPRKDEVLCVILCARKKYCISLGRSHELLDYTILKHKNVNKLIRFLRVEDGDFYDGDTPIPVSSMVCYIDLYPKSCLKAIEKFYKEVHQWMYQAVVDRGFDISIFKKINTKLFSAIHRSTSRKPVTIVDIDCKDRKLLETLPEPDWITETRGGYHCIYLKRDSNLIKDILAASIKVKEIETQFSSGRTVIPGTVQGGFRVRSCIL